MMRAISPLEIHFRLEDLHMPNLRWSDVVEMLIIAFLIYQILSWAKNTRLWTMLKGIMVIFVFVVLAYLFHMNTILWLVRNVVFVAAVALVVVMQPELRSALQGLGERRFIKTMLPFDLRPGVSGERFSDRTIDEVARACVEMAAVRTGALIVIEQDISLAEYERTGIQVDGIVTAELLINIFEHNTPLHDGAVVMRGDRVTAATCYLPLSDRTDIGKEMGTRHRAGVGISEATDALTLIVSEETGAISATYRGDIVRGLNAEGIRERMRQIQNKTEEDKGASKQKGVTGLFGRSSRKEGS